MTVVAISAAYGARGGQIGPELAGRLDVPFVDRALAHAVAGRLDVSLEEAINHWEPASRSFLERMVSAFLGADTVAPVGPPPELVTPHDFCRATEAVVLEQAATGRGVILGRGCVAVLRDDPRVLRVRLTGPADRRLALAIAAGELSEQEARSAMAHLDRYHRDYLRQFYDAEIDDPALYHLAIDATALAPETCVDLIVHAAESLP